MEEGRRAQGSKGEEVTEIPSDLELQLRGRIAMLEEDRENLLSRNASLLSQLESAERERDKGKRGWAKALDDYHDADNERTNLRIALKESNKQRGIAGDTIHRLRGEAALAREGAVVDEVLELKPLRFATTTAGLRELSETPNHELRLEG